NERRADIGMAGKRHLGAWRENAHRRGVRRIFRGQHEGGFRKVELRGDGLHLLCRKPFRVQHNGERIAAELTVGEDVDGDEIQLHGRSSQNVTTPRIDWPFLISSNALLMSLSGITWVIIGSISILPCIYQSTIFGTSVRPRAPPNAVPFQTRPVTS